MSQAEKHLNSASTSENTIETVYTTVEAQTDQTDWLTVVSNLRQGNRQLLEQIAKLEQALATSQQSLQTHKEEKQSQEITILQLQDEIKMAEERIGGLFQQLESSHQIGQRQQTLIETLSQQLEITQAIVPELEAEHNDLRQENQKLVEKLTKTEQVALELHRRLKYLQAATQSKSENPSGMNQTPPEDGKTGVNPHHIEEPTKAATENPGSSPTHSSPQNFAKSVGGEIDSHLADANILPVSKSPLRPTAVSLPDPLTAATEVTDKESTVEVHDLEETEDNTPHWPAPKLDRQRPVNKTGGLKLDLPKFPKK
jgi:hypothetical protein